MFRTYELRVEKPRLTGFNVRQDDFSGLDLANQGTGTRSFSYSNLFRRRSVALISRRCPGP